MEKLNLKEIYCVFYFLFLFARNWGSVLWFGFLKAEVLDEYFIVGAIIALVLISFSKPTFNKLYKAVELVFMGLFLMNFENKPVYVAVLLMASALVLIVKVGGSSSESESKGTS